MVEVNKDAEALPEQVPKLKQSEVSKKQPKNIEPYFKKDQFIIDKKYKIQKRVGYGSFGQVFIAGFKNSKDRVAIKVEEVKEGDVHHTQVLLKKEGEVMKSLQGKLPIPKVYDSDYYPEESGNYFFLSMDYMGMNLNELLGREVNKKFSIETCLNITTQMIRTLKLLHGEGYVHRDIKPDNFLIGPTETTKNQVYLLDYGLTVKYRMDDGTHVEKREEQGMVGTGFYASINTHNHITKSRRDDLEEICYVLSFFANGSLPWRNISSSDEKERYKLWGQKKEECPPQEIFANMPQVYIDFYTYVRGLQYEEEPDYDKFIDLFEAEMKNQEIPPQRIKMDWDPPDPVVELKYTVQEMAATLEKLKAVKA